MAAVLSRPWPRGLTPLGSELAICAGCGHESAAGAKFCADCGRSLALACPACGTSHPAGARFCAECGAPLQAAGAATPAAAAAVAERRLVSVLFADLVGFTTLSEGRDPEEVRELLSRYFEVARTLVGRYGGTIEKFIGDAVMAVWGAPVAREDDAERAVRRRSIWSSQSRRSVTSRCGREAPSWRGDRRGSRHPGRQGEGMVAGDLVNTAARVQATADAGSVLVNDATRRASNAAIGYDDAGSHTLKGKSETVQLWRALQVTASRGGAVKRRAGAALRRA